MIIKLQRDISAVCPICSVSTPDHADKSTWQIEFAPNATDAERAAAMSVMESFDPFAITTDQVNDERERRLSNVVFNGHEFQFDGASQANIAGAGTLAFAAIIAGTQPGDMRWSNPDSDFTWLASDNVSVPMDAQTMWDFARTSAQWKQEHIYAARKLKDMKPIPTDYTDDKWWP